MTLIGPVKIVIYLFIYIVLILFSSSAAEPRYNRFKYIIVMQIDHLDKNTVLEFKLKYVNNNIIRDNFIAIHDNEQG